MDIAHVIFTYMITLSNQVQGDYDKEKLVCGGCALGEVNKPNNPNNPNNP